MDCGHWRVWQAGLLKHYLGMCVCAAITLLLWFCMCLGSLMVVGSTLFCWFSGLFIDLILCSRQRFLVVDVWLPLLLNNINIDINFKRFATCDQARINTWAPWGSSPGTWRRRGPTSLRETEKIQQKPPKSHAHFALTGKQSLKSKKHEHSYTVVLFHRWTGQVATRVNLIVHIPLQCLSHPPPWWGGPQGSIAARLGLLVSLQPLEPSPGPSVTVVQL